MHGMQHSDELFKAFAIDSECEAPGAKAIADAAYNVVPHIIWTAAPDGDTDFINALGATQTGEEEATFHKWGWLGVVHPEDVDHAKAKWQSSVDSGAEYRNEYRVRQLDGSYHWFLSQATAIRGESHEIVKWIGSWTDIDDLKQAQEKASQDAILLANVHDSIVVTDLDCVITFWNKGAERIFGWMAEELLGRPVVDRYPADRRADIAAAMQAIFDGKEWSGEYEDYRKDGSRVWIDARVTLMRNDRGTPLGLIGICHDISERKRLELERQKLIAVVEASPEFIGIADANQRVTYVNPAGRELVGLSSNQEVNATSIRDFFSEEEWRRVEPIALPALRNERRWDGEVLFRHFNSGQEIPVHWNPFTARADDGSLSFYACVARDLRRERASEESVWASERRFRAFMEHSPIGAWITDAEGRVIYMNDQLLQMCPDLTPEAIGKTAFDLHSPDLANVYWNRIQAVITSGEAMSGIEPGPRSDGSLGEHMVYRFPIPTPSGMCVGGVSFDITEQRRTAELLRLRDRAIQSVGQGITITDPHSLDNPIIYASPTFLRLTGYDESEVLGRNCRFLCGPATADSARKRLREAIKSCESATVEILNYRRDGSHFWNEVSIAPVFDPDGRLTHYVGVQTDVTERRKLEDQIRQSQKMEAIGQLAGGIAHDFSNLLTVITAYCDVLLQSDSIGSKERDSLREISLAGEMAADLTRQLVAFGKSQLMEPEVTNLNAVISETENMLRRLLGANIEIVIRLAKDLKCVVADRSQLSQVILNLAINARDAMPDGGTLLFATHNLTLSPELIAGREQVSAGDFVVLTVSDSGHGMTPEIAERIFEPFFSKKVHGVGTGLGLSVVHGVVSQSGGFITVKSTPGAGATFEVHLPATELRPPSLLNSLSSTELPCGNETIMVVEDEPKVRHLSCHILYRCGYRVLEAADPESAIAQLRSEAQPIDLLITDVVMPGMGGQHLSELLLSEGLARRTLLVSGDPRSIRERAHACRGQETFLKKPFSPANLAAKVRAILDDDSLTMPSLRDSS